MFGVRVSALWVCPAWGEGVVEGHAREQMVVTGQEGSRARRQGVTARVQPLALAG